MKFEYDKEVDGLFIWFVDNIDKEKHIYAGEIWPEELNEKIGILFDKKGKIMGLEILSASKYMYKKYLKND